MTNPAPVSEAPSLAAAPAQSSLRTRVISGSVWTLLSYGGSQVLRLAGNVIFSRLLYPEAFGVMLLVNVFIQGLAMFSDIGIGPSIIQSRRGDEPGFLDTAWTIQVGRGFLLWIASLIGAHPFAVYYHEPQLASLIPVAGLGAVLSGFNSTRIFTSGRRISLARITILDFIGQTIGIVAMVVWCFATRSVWAFIFGNLIGVASKMVLSYTFLDGERNGFAFDREAFRELSRFGRWVFVSTALTFFTTQIDRLMLGQLLDKVSLGLYSIAINLATLPPMVASSLAGGVLFPLLAHHSRTDPEEGEKTLFAARRVILLGGMFLLAGLVLVSPAFFHTFYQARYHGAIRVTQLLAVPMWCWILMISADRAVLATGHSHVLATSNAASLAVKFAACYFGFRFGDLAGFILGLALGNLAGHVPIVLALRRRGTHIVRQDLAFTAIALGSIGAALLVQRLLPADLARPGRSLAEVAIALVVLVPIALRAKSAAREALSLR
jgi:O-antigen/teichoic acid export membrane protein